MFKKRNIYRMLKYSNDFNAIMKGKIFKRLGRRIGGKMSGNVLRNLFK